MVMECPRCGKDVFVTFCDRFDLEDHEFDNATTCECEEGAGFVTTAEVVAEAIAQRDAALEDMGESVQP